MNTENKESKIQEFLTRAVEAIYPSKEELEERLRSGQRLTVYMGIDPTAEELHIGHASQLFKLKRLQDMGHRIILLIGDFTAMIGDPTGKAATRVKLSKEQVLKNAHSYRQQAGKILNFDHPTNPIEMRYNSTWLGTLNAEQLVELASMMTVQQMSQRDMFQQRFKNEKPVWIHEFLYPLFQGWDSVAMDVDIEIGGRDQIFNMLVGTEFVKRKLGKQKYVVAGTLLADPSGKKIGKTEGNMIALSDAPENMYHKIMMWGDAIVPHALELCTTISMEQFQAILKHKSGKEGKMLLARAIVTEFYSEEAANQAERYYEQISSGDVPLESIQETQFFGAKSVIEMLVELQLAPSKSEARRLIANRGVRIDHGTVEESSLTLSPRKEPYLVHVGKRKAENFRRVLIS
jgi:tyrosyl-tRNA synthetase